MKSEVQDACPDTNSNLNLIHGLEQIRRTRRIVA